MSPIPAHASLVLCERPAVAVRQKWARSPRFGHFHSNFRTSSWRIIITAATWHERQVAVAFLTICSLMVQTKRRLKGTPVHSSLTRCRRGLKLDSLGVRVASPHHLLLRNSMRTAVRPFSCFLESIDSMGMSTTRPLGPPTKGKQICCC